MLFELLYIFFLIISIPKKSKAELIQGILFKSSNKNWKKKIKKL